MVTKKNNIHFRRSGNKNGQCVVFSHSLASTSDMWLPQIGVLESEYDVIRYDIRGHGDSACPAGGWSLTDMANDLHELLQQLGKPRAHIIGLSMGAMIAQQFYALYPESVRSLVLANTTCYYGPDRQAMWDQRIEAVQQGGIEAIVEPTAKRWFTPRFYEEQKEQIDWIKKLIRETRAEGFIACCQALKPLDLRQEIQHIAVPTTIIVGKEDPTTPVQDAAYLAQHIPNAKLHILEDAAHISNLEQPALFNEALRAHFGGLRAG